MCKFYAVTSFELFARNIQISEDNIRPARPHLRILFPVDIFTGDKKSLTPDKMSRVVRSAVPGVRMLKSCSRPSSLSRLSLANCGKISDRAFHVTSSRGPGSAENCDDSLAAPGASCDSGPGRVIKHDMFAETYKRFTEQLEQTLSPV